MKYKPAQLVLAILSGSDTYDVNTFIQACTYARTHACTHTNKHTRTRTRTHTMTHTMTHTHIHATHQNTYRRRRKSCHLSHIWTKRRKPLLAPRGHILQLKYQRPFHGFFVLDVADSPNRLMYMRVRVRPCMFVCVRARVCVCVGVCM